MGSNPTLSANPEAPASPRAVEALVDIEIARHYLRGCGSTLVGMCFSSTVLLAALWRSVDHRLLIGWAFCFAAVSLLRWQWIRRYQQLGGSQAPGEVATLFAERHAGSAFVNGVLWGGLALMIDHTSSPQQLFLVSLVIVGSIGIAVYSLGPYRPAFVRFTNTILAAATASNLWNLWIDPSVTLLWGLLVLMPVFWVLVHKLATDYRDVVRTTLRLRLEKDDLIESLQAQTRRAQAAVQVKARFLASAAHDLRQPVHALSLYADWLGQEPEMANEIIPKIRKSTQAVNSLFDSLFDMARLDSGAMQPTRQLVALNDVMDALLVEFVPAAAEKGLSLRVRSADATIESDPVWLRRIASNLISNAIRYTDAGGVLIAVRLKESSQGPRASLEVWDTGRGIAPADQSRVFDEFYRSGDARGSEQGFGLGLAIANRLSRGLGYGLRLASRQGRGTVVRLDLGPVVRTPHSESALDPVALLAQAHLWVLEPSAHRALGLRRVLADHGLSVRVETTFDALLNRGEEVPDVAVLQSDVASPSRLAEQVQALRKRHPRCAVVLGVEAITPHLRRKWAADDVLLTPLPLHTRALLTVCADAFAQAGESTEP